MADEVTREDEPCYVISVAAKMVSLHPQTLRYYDRIGLLKPSRTSGRQRLYSRREVESLRRIARLTDDLGVNLAGVEVILNMSERIEELQQELESVQREAEARIQYLQRRLAELEGRGTPISGAGRAPGGQPPGEPEVTDADEVRPL